MPATPLHYPFAFLISKSDKRLSLPALIVGSVMPDIEVPILWVFFSTLPDHQFLHSLIGAATVGTLLTVVVTRFLYAPLVSTIFNVDRTELEEVCRITPWLIASSFIGVMSHLILDFPMHRYNPILWPWVDPYDVVGPLILILQPFFGFWNAYVLTSILLHTSMIALWIGIIIVLRAKGNLWSRHWIRDQIQNSESQS